MLRYVSLLLVLLPIALIQWHSSTTSRIEIHHFPSGTLKKREKVLSKDWIWDVPVGWEPGPAQAMRLATYKIPVGKGFVELAVSELPGPAGGLLSNVNRWRGQLGLGPLDDSGLEGCMAPSPMAEPGAKVVAIPAPGESAEGGEAMLVGLLETPRATTFLKLSGSSALVATVRSHFMDFMASMRRRHPEGSIR